MWSTFCFLVLPRLLIPKEGVLERGAMHYELRGGLRGPSPPGGHLSSPYSSPCPSLSTLLLPSLFLLLLAPSSHSLTYLPSPSTPPRPLLFLPRFPPPSSPSLPGTTHRAPAAATSSATSLLIVRATISKTNPQLFHLQFHKSLRKPKRHSHGRE